MTAVFDAELYLRRMGEQLLADSKTQLPDPSSGLRGAAAALVAIDAIAADQAWLVIDDYRTATLIRSGKPGFVNLAPPEPRRAANKLLPRQFRVINKEIPVGGRQVLLRDLAITADGGTLRYRRRLAAPGSIGEPRLTGRAETFRWNHTPPDIIDSDGHRPQVLFGEGGRDGEGYVDGELELRGTIALGAAWLEVDSAEVGLRGDTVRWEVGIRSIQDRSRLESFLWRHLATADSQSEATNDLELMIKALVAAGALQEGQRPLEDLRAVSVHMPRHPLHQRDLPTGTTRSLVEPWGSLLSRLGADDGPVWTLVLGAVAPPCDGVQFAANSITSHWSGFDVEFDVAPNLWGTRALDEMPIAWWARDDLENYYLGTPERGGVRADSAQGTLRYWPALNPRAKRLDLLMCAESHQAVISLSLPGPSENDSE